VVVVTAASEGETVMPAANAADAETSRAANTQVKHKNLKKLFILPPQTVLRT
jgi:hypothetical protein